MITNGQDYRTFTYTRLQGQLPGCCVPVSSSAPAVPSSQICHRNPSNPESDHIIPQIKITECFPIVLWAFPTIWLHFLPPFSCSLGYIYSSFLVVSWISQIHSCSLTLCPCIANSLQSFICCSNISFLEVFSVTFSKEHTQPHSVSVFFTALAILWNYILIF